MVGGRRHRVDRASARWSPSAATTVGLGTLPLCTTTPRHLQGRKRSWPPGSVVGVADSVNGVVPPLVAQHIPFVTVSNPLTMTRSPPPRSAVLPARPRRAGDAWPARQLLRQGLRLATAGVLVRYRRHIARPDRRGSPSVQFAVVPAGTIGDRVAMSLAAAMMLGVETQRGLDLVGMNNHVRDAGHRQHRELAPVVVVIALAAMSEPASPAQIGAMRISDEIDALDAMESSRCRSWSAPACSRHWFASSRFMIGLLASYPSTRNRRGVLQRRLRKFSTTFFHLVFSVRATLGYPCPRRWCSPSSSRWRTAPTGISAGPVARLAWGQGCRPHRRIGHPRRGVPTCR